MRSDVVFARKAYAAMLDWKNNLADKYALLVEGARRVGKTCLGLSSRNTIRSFISISRERQERWMPSSGLFRSLRVFRT